MRSPLWARLAVKLWLLMCVYRVGLLIWSVSRSVWCFVVLHAGRVACVIASLVSSFSLVSAAIAPSFVRRRCASALPRDAGVLGTTPGRLADPVFLG